MWRRRRKRDPREARHKDNGMLVAIRILCEQEGSFLDCLDTSFVEKHRTGDI